jgi:hypothetical protein
MTAIDKHKKCIKVLEMIGDCDLMLQQARHYFAMPTARKIPEVESGYKSDLTKYTAIKDRLNNYYNNLLKNIS